MAKQMRWPKWTNQYEEVKENNKVYRPVTRVDRAWNIAAYIGLGLISAVRNLATGFRKVRGYD